MPFILRLGAACVPLACRWCAATNPSMNRWQRLSSVAEPQNSRTFRRKEARVEQWREYFGT